MTARYRILPGLFCRYRLERWRGLPFLGFWEMDSGGDSYDYLAETVRQCGGMLVNRPSTPDTLGEKIER